MAVDLKGASDSLTQQVAAGPAGAGPEERRKQEAGRGAEGLPAGAASSSEAPVELAGERPARIGRAGGGREPVNRREHRLVTVLLDGSELGFAPVAFCRSGDHASAAINKPRTIAGGWQHHGILMATRGLMRTVTSIK